MAEEKITPEEKLLKIIENPNVEKAAILASKVTKPAKGGGKAAAGWLKGVRLNKETLKHFDLRMGNKVVAVGCGLFTIFWIFDFIWEGANFNRRFEKVSTEAATSKREKESKAEINVKISDILIEAKKRNIFSFVPTKEETKIQMEDAVAVIGNFKLVGILWSDNPQAMIEDTKQQKTFLVNAGDEIAQLKIKRIFRDKVILGKNEREWELR